MAQLAGLHAVCLPCMTLQSSVRNRCSVMYIARYSSRAALSNVCEQSSSYISRREYNVALVLAIAMVLSFVYSIIINNQSD